MAERQISLAGMAASVALLRERCSFAVHPSHRFFEFENLLAENCFLGCTFDVSCFGPTVARSFTQRTAVSALQKALDWAGADDVLIVPQELTRDWRDMVRFCDESSSPYLLRLRELFLGRMRHMRYCGGVRFRRLGAAALAQVIGEMAWPRLFSRHHSLWQHVFALPVKSPVIIDPWPEDSPGCPKGFVLRCYGDASASLADVARLWGNGRNVRVDRAAGESGISSSYPVHLAHHTASLRTVPPMSRRAVSLVDMRKALSLLRTCCKVDMVPAEFRLEINEFMEVRQRIAHDFWLDPGSPCVDRKFPMSRLQGLLEATLEWAGVDGAMLVPAAPTVDWREMVCEAPTDGILIDLKELFLRGELKRTGFWGGVMLHGFSAFAVARMVSLLTWPFPQSDEVWIVPSKRRLAICAGHERRLICYSEDRRCLRRVEALWQKKG